MIEDRAFDLRALSSQIRHKDNLASGQPLMIDIVSPSEPDTKLRPLVVLGGGYQNNLPNRPPADLDEAMSYQRMAQELRAVAAVIILNNPNSYGHFDTIITLGGETAAGWPTDADLMAHTIKHYASQISLTLPDNMVIQEPKSIDTQENIAFFGEMQQMFQLGNPSIISHDFYDTWTKNFLDHNQIIPAQVFDADEIVAAIPEYAPLVEKFQQSDEFQFWQNRGRILNKIPAGRFGDPLRAAVHGVSLYQAHKGKR